MSGIERKGWRAGGKEKAGGWGRVGVGLGRIAVGQRGAFKRCASHKATWT